MGRRLVMEIVDPARYRSTPWKNGAGTTVDIAEEMLPGSYPGSWDGLVWRLGRTRIEAPGPFSDLTGYNRILTVIEGRGLRLRSGEKWAIDATRPFVPVRFPGEWRITTELDAGPVGVLNLIADRNRVAMDLVILSAPGEATVNGDLALLYAPTGRACLSLEGDKLELPHDGAVKILLDQPATFTVLSGRIAVATIQIQRTT